MSIIPFPAADGITTKSVTLGAIAEINQEHRLAHSCAKDAISHAVRCGELLADLKKNLPHGQFQNWIKQNCAFSYSTANRYIRAAEQISQGQEICSLSRLFPSGRSKLKKTAAIEASKPVNVPPDVNEAGADADDPEIMIQVGRTKERLHASTPLTWLGFGLDGASGSLEKSIAQYEEYAKKYPEVAQYAGREVIEEVSDKLGNLERLCANIRRRVKLLEGT